MELGDAWLAADKLHHLLASLLITLLAAYLASRSRSPFLRRRSSAVGSVAALLAGVAKEAADELGLWPSAGASPKDAVADLAGVLLANISIILFRRFRLSSHRDPDRDRAVSLV